MTVDDLTAYFEPLQTRTEVRTALATQLAVLAAPGRATTLDAHEIAALLTGNDREVMQSMLRVKNHFRARRRSAEAHIGSELHELFAKAIERMKQLPPEPQAPQKIDAVRQVRRT